MAQDVDELRTQVRRLTAERDALQLSVAELSAELRQAKGKDARPDEPVANLTTAFDPEWYLDQYKDVVQLGMDPFEHYHWIGRRLGRAPNKRALKKNVARSLAGFWQTLR